MRFFGVVVLYHPDDEVVKNIRTYVGAVEMLYVIDNSEQPDERIGTALASMEHVCYLPYHENRGIGVALNDALQRAAQAGADYLLTMDQDSSFYPEGIAQYFSQIEQYKDDKNRILQFAIPYTPLGNSDFGTREIPLWITSGSAVNVSSARAIDGWNELLFIDEVDSEFCCRGRANGYKTIQFSSPLFHHNLGEEHIWHILGREVHGANHNAIRKYYMFRNRIYLMRRYPWLRREYLRRDVSRILKIILFEEDKTRKIWYSLRGIMDALRGKYGKISF